MWVTGSAAILLATRPVDVDGQPRHEDAPPRPAFGPGAALVIAAAPHLFGFPDDAATIADAVRAHLDT